MHGLDNKGANRGGSIEGIDASLVVGLKNFKSTLKNAEEMTDFATKTPDGLEIPYEKLTKEDCVGAFGRVMQAKNQLDALEDQRTAMIERLEGISGERLDKAKTKFPEEEFKKYRETIVALESRLPKGIEPKDAGFTTWPSE